MARSFSLSILFCLLFSAMCDHGNGARNVMHNDEEIKTVPELDLKDPSLESSLDKTTMGSAEKILEQEKDDKMGLQGKGEVQEQYVRDLFSSLLFSAYKPKNYTPQKNAGNVKDEQEKDDKMGLQGKGEVQEQLLRDLFSSLLFTAYKPKNYPTQKNDDNVKDQVDDSHLKDSRRDNEPRPSSEHKVLNVLNIGLFAFNELQVGKIFPIHFPTNGASPHFLPKSVADSIPFKSSELQNILRILSIPQDSYLAERMEATLKVCESKPVEGETKACATSLESLLEFLQGAFGTGAKFEVFTTIGPKMASSALLNYMVLDAPKEIETPKNVVCHPMGYAYEVFHCHYFASERKAYKVTLGIENGEKVESIAVCHMDTSSWNADSFAFDLLGVKHGDPICHFIPPGHFIWVQSPIKQTAI